MKVIENKKLKFISYPVGENIIGWNKVTKEYARIIKELVTIDDNITLIVAGSSGAMLSTMVYLHLKNYKVYIVHVKKDGENSHSNSKPSFPRPSACFIIDDQIDTGNTVNRLLAAYPYTEFEAIIVGGKVYVSHIKGNCKALYCFKNIN